MRNPFVAVLIAALLTWPLSATSARTIHPELVGFREVSLNFSPQTVPGLDTNALEKRIRDRIEAAGLLISESAPTILFVQIKYRQLPSCPGSLLIQTHLAVSEDAEVKRDGRTQLVYVDTYEEDEVFIEPVGNAAEVASTSTLALIEHVLDARAYTTEVLAEQK